MKLQYVIKNIVGNVKLVIYPTILFAGQIKWIY
ncbi:hypothetical protein SEEH5111_22411 [Salmonella enterica subsp. enterica serovar Heidelberg str. 640151-11]|nr:hypothetical protein SEEH5111_22411 [Salmonella enterica subsp. enterica serovar Heidelberg str. 640151-11]